MVLAGIVLTGCASKGSSESAGGEPAHVEAIEGSEVSKVTVTEEGAGRIGMKTEPERVLTTNGIATPARTVIPLAAVLYDKDGVRPGPTPTPSRLPIVPQQVVIDHVDRDNAILASGPAARHRGRHGGRGRAARRRVRGARRMTASCAGATLMRWIVETSLRFRFIVVAIAAC